MQKTQVLLPTLYAATLAVAAMGWNLWWKDQQALRDAAFVRQRISFLEAETERLRGILSSKQRQTDSADADIRRKQIESTVSTLRSLAFLSPVSYRQIPRSQLPVILRQKLGQQIPDQEFDQTSVALATLGLIPPGLDLKKTYLGLLGEQVGAFYDQHSKELFTFSGQSLAETQNQVILAHELTHALEDQHFHLERLPLEAKGNDDRSLAASALVEGDATLVMNQYMLDHLTAASVRESLSTTLTTDLRQLAAAPRYLRETLLFPYLRGQEFCQALYARGGWAELAKAFEHPPASSSQILHPERFLAEPREEPVQVNFPAGPIRGRLPIGDNVLGEFGLRHLLGIWTKDDKRGAEIASGWQGDRYLVFGDARTASYVWEIVWHGQRDSERFAAAAAAALGGITEKNAPVTATPNSTDPGEHLGKAWRQGARYILVTINESQRRTAIINAQDMDWLKALQSRIAADFTPSDVQPSRQP